MKSWLGPTALGAALLLAAPALGEATEGAEAPDFTLKGHLGENVTLSQFKGKRNVLLAFFPQAFTGG